MIRRMRGHSEGSTGAAAHLVAAATGMTTTAILPQHQQQFLHRPRSEELCKASARAINRPTWTTPTSHTAAAGANNCSANIQSNHSQSNGASNSNGAISTSAEGELGTTLLNNLLTSLLALEIDVAHLDTSLFLLFDEMRSFHASFIQLADEEDSQERTNSLSSLSSTSPTCPSSNSSPITQSTSPGGALVTVSTTAVIRAQKIRLLQLLSRLAELATEVRVTGEMVELISMQVVELENPENEGVKELKSQVSRIEKDLNTIARGVERLGAWGDDVYFGWHFEEIIGLPPGHEMPRVGMVGEGSIQEQLGVVRGGLMKRMLRENSQRWSLGGGRPRRRRSTASSVYSCATSGTRRTCGGSRRYAEGRGGVKRVESIIQHELAEKDRELAESPVEMDAGQLQRQPSIAFSYTATIASTAGSIYEDYCPTAFDNREGEAEEGDEAEWEEEQDENEQDGTHNLDDSISAMISLYRSESTASNKTLPPPPPPPPIRPRNPRRIVPRTPPSPVPVPSSPRAYADWYEPLVNGGLLLPPLAARKSITNGGVLGMPPTPPVSPAFANLGCNSGPATTTTTTPSSRVHSESNHLTPPTNNSHLPPTPTTPTPAPATKYLCHPDPPANVNRNSIIRRKPAPSLTPLSTSPPAPSCPSSSSTMSAASDEHAPPLPPRPQPPPAQLSATLPHAAGHAEPGKCWTHFSPASFPSPPAIQQQQLAEDEQLAIRLQQEYDREAAEGDREDLDGSWRPIKLPAEGSAPAEGSVVEYYHPDDNSNRVRGRGIELLQMPPRGKVYQKSKRYTSSPLLLSSNTSPNPCNGTFPSTPALTPGLTATSSGLSSPSSMGSPASTASSMGWSWSNSGSPVTVYPPTSEEPGKRKRLVKKKTLSFGMGGRSSSPVLHGGENDNDGAWGRSGWYHDGSSAENHRTSTSRWTLGMPRRRRAVSGLHGYHSNGDHGSPMMNMNGTRIFSV